MFNAKKYDIINDQIHSCFAFLEKHTFFLLGESISIPGDCVIDKLYVSPSGQLVIIDSRLTLPASSADEVYSNLSKVSSVLRNWRHGDLDAALEDHLYEVVGQAFNAGELMVRHGAFTYSDVKAFDSSVDVSLFNGVPVLLQSNQINMVQAEQFSKDLASSCDIPTAVA